MTHKPHGRGPGTVAPGGAEQAPKEKPTWPGAAEGGFEEQSACSVPTSEKIINDEPKDYATMRARFALRGRVLTRSHRVPDGHITFVVTSWAGARYFSHLHDLQAFLNQVMEAAI